MWLVILKLTAKRLSLGPTYSLTDHIEVMRKSIVVIAFPDNQENYYLMVSRPSMFVRFFHLRGFEMQREGNCPLNARAFTKLKLLTVFFRMSISKCQSSGGSVVWNSLVCSGKAIAHSMPALLRS